MRIKENFRDIIFFEDEPDKVEKCKNALLGNQFYYLFFVRRKHHESSKFYDIMIRDIS